MTDSKITLPYIEDPTLFKAVCFARSLKRKGKSMPLAISTAAKYYGLTQKEVAREMGKIGAVYSRKERIWKEYKTAKNEDLNE